jgi:hypothetical protein
MVLVEREREIKSIEGITLSGDSVHMGTNDSFKKKIKIIF